MDTTYLLPVIGISVKGIPRDALIRLIKWGNSIFISEISLFELSAKGAKHIAAGRLPAKRVSRGISAIVHDETIETIPIYETKVLLTAFKIRRLIPDFIDCLILSSAMNRCEVLITEDSDIQNLKEDKEFKEILATINPNFQIETINQALRTRGKACISEDH